MELFNSGDGEVDLSGVAVEILSGEEDEANLDGNETGKWIDAVKCEGKPGGLAREVRRLAGPSKKPGAALAADPGFWAAPPSLGGRGACGDVRPEGSAAQLRPAEELGQVPRRVDGARRLCEKTCGRCKSLGKPLSARSQRNGGAVLSSCVLAAKLGSSSSSGWSQISDSGRPGPAAWSVAREDAGVHCGTRGRDSKNNRSGRRAGAAARETPGRENAEGLALARSGRTGRRVGMAGLASPGKVQHGGGKLQKQSSHRRDQDKRWIPDDPKTREPVAPRARPRDEGIRFGGHRR